MPRTLYRIQPRLPVSLRDFDLQRKKGRSSFDVVTHDGLVEPLAPEKQSAFSTPNGMSLRPDGQNLRRILSDFQGTPMIYRMHEGLEIPASFSLFHEHSDHYSLQTSGAVSLADLNHKLTSFLEALPPPQTREQFFAQLNDEDDQDN